VGLYEIQAMEWLFVLLDCIKECYEAVVIYSFLELLMSLAGLEKGDEYSSKDMHHIFPFNWIFGHEKVNEVSTERLRWMTLQFVIIRPFVSVQEEVCV
jgi:hypothetical protein